MSIIRKAILFLSITFLQASTYSQVKLTLQDTINSPAELLKNANAIINNYPDSSYIIYKKILPIFTEGGDTQKVVQCHYGIADIYKNKGQYSLSSDHLWDALLLAEEIKDTLFLIDIHMEIGGIYRVFEKAEKAIENFETALQLSKMFLRMDYMRTPSLKRIYFAFAIQYREMQNYPKAITYLDSCSALNKDITHQVSTEPFVYAERGNIFMKMGRLDNAQYYLEKANTYFVNKNRAYQIISKQFLGDLHLEKQNWNEAIEYYTKALEALELFKSHSDVRVDVLKGLSLSYEKLGDFGTAYNHLVQATILTDSLYDARSAINSELFQIKDKHAETIREKDAFIKQQNQVIEKKNLIQSRLKLLIIFILFVVTVSIVLVWMRYRLRRLSIEKREIQLQAKYDHEKTRVIMEVKSRELTSNTLQMIEKEQLVDELLVELKKESPASYKHMKTKISKGSKDMWEQFNKRFTEVNTQFYDKLREKHPNLTPTEQKHCALIKLNFNSKEMASLLNISLNSVHISRHRIRKKIGMDRDDNLSNYIADI